MAVTRADKYTQIGKKQEYFSDFLDNFDKHPITNNIARITNEESIKQSLKNLVLTNLGERVFEPTIGSNIRAAMFEQNDVVSAEIIINAIKNTVRFNEPRVELLDVLANPDPDNYGFNVSIVFSIINNPDPIVLEFLLKRVR